MSTDLVHERLAGSWEFGPVHSAATFSVKYLVAPFRGEFEAIDAQLADGVLRGSVDVTSINVKDENFAAHLAGPDFFDAERHPRIVFESSAIEIVDDAVTLDGQLTLKGVTRPIHATGTINGPTEDFMGMTRIGLTLTTTIDRTEYGVSWNAPLPKGGAALADEVTLNVELEFIKQG